LAGRRVDLTGREASAGQLTISDNNKQLAIAVPSSMLPALRFAPFRVGVIVRERKAPTQGRKKATSSLLKP